MSTGDLSYRPVLVWRLILIVALCFVSLAAGGAVLVWLAYRSLPNAGADISATLGALLVRWWPLLVAAWALVWVVATLLVFVVLRPLRHLVVAAKGSDTRLLPTDDEGEVGEIARMLEQTLRSGQQYRFELTHQRTIAENLEQQIDAITRLSQSLYRSPDVGAALIQVAAELQTAFRCDQAGIALVQPDTIDYYLSSATDESAMVLRAPRSGASLAERVLERGNLQRINDLPSQPELAAPGIANPRSALGVPMHMHLGPPGVVFLQSRRSATFDEQDISQLVRIAGYLSSAVEHVWQFYSERGRRRAVESVMQAARALGAALAPGRVPEVLLDHLGDVLPYDRCVVLLVDGDMLEVRASRGHEELAAYTRVPANTMPLIEDILTTRQPVVLSHASAEPRYRTFDQSSATQSWLGVPLERQERVAGILVLEQARPDAYGDDELRAAEALAQQAVSAIDNARLFAEARERAERLEVVAHSTQVISTRDVSRDLPAILRIIIHQMRRVVPCDYAALALYQDESFFVETVYDYTASHQLDNAANNTSASTNTPWQTAYRTSAPVVQHDLARSAFADDRQLVEKGLRSSVVVPIIGASKPIGALQFASSQPSVYTTSRISALLELSHYLGTALHNAQLQREREETAVKLARTEEHLNLVDKVRVVGQLASGVAHDFNNLLAGVLGNAQLLLMEIDDAEQRDMLSVIVQAAKDGTETVRRLQGFARMEHDSPMTEVRVDQLARDAIDITRPRWRDVAQSRGASISITRDLQPVTPIAGRPAELREVLTNLIINAADAMPRGGHITVRTFMNPVADSDEVVIEIEDQGVGIPDDVRERIFDPFFTTKGEQGTGLGLPVSLGIIQSHGGTIEVDTTPGEGTRFVVRLPVREAGASQAELFNVPDTMVPGHILFVESDDVVRGATCRILARWGHKVTEATNAAAALEKFAPGRYDVVMSDLGMPDMNGWELLSLVRQRDADVPTVLITGWGLQDSTDEARARGIDVVIEKPFDQDTLRAALGAALSVRR